MTPIALPCRRPVTAPRGARKVVFGVIAGTGVGGGIVVDGKVLGGAHGVGGEWGHIPLPAPSARGSDECARLLLRQAWLSGSLVQRSGAGCGVRARYRTRGHG